MTGGIRTRLVTIMLLALIPMASLFVWYASEQRATALNRLDEQQEVRAPARAETVARILSGARSTVQILALHAGENGSAQDVEQLMDEIVSMDEYTFATLVSPEGDVALSRPQRNEQVNISDRGWFRRVLESQEFEVGGHQVGVISGLSEVAVAIPIFDTGGAVSGYAAVGVAADHIADSLLRVEPPTGTQLVLLDAEGRVITVVPAEPGSEGNLFHDAAAVREVIARGGGRIEARGPVGTTRSYAFAPVPETDELLFVAAGYDPAIVFEPDQVTYRNALMALGFVALITAILSWAVGRNWITEPVTNLTQVTQRIGHGDFSARTELPTERSDEFGVLAREYDEMTVALEQKIAELEAARAALTNFNAELEQRVRQRTAELENSNRELEAFSYSVSHDLRAPLRSIAGFSQGIAEDFAEELGEEGMSDLNRVRSAANRMGEMIDALLALSRLQRVELAARDVDLSALAERMVAELREAEPDRQVEVEIQPGLSSYGDATLIEALLQNLLSNAWKFSARAEQPRIAVGMRDTEKGTAFFVEDNGAGFDMSYADKLFGAFQRLHAQDEYPGVGIGLTTAARIVRRHGGDIWADAEPGKGATFYFKLS
jgi:signal transduction histidine kinase